MINTSLILMTLALVPLTIKAGAAQAGAAGEAITLTVSGTQAQGKVFGQVFADPATFKARDKALLRFAIEPKGTAAVQTTLTLPKGRYAIVLFQDTKGTGKVETNMFGMPTVPYGFSNNARGTMGPPAWDAAAFDVAGNAALSIQLR